MKKKEAIAGLPVTIIFDEMKFIVKDREGKTLVDIPCEYVRAILGLVAVMADEEVPAFLEKTYVNQDT